jgi:hypothetical protein
VHVYLHKYFRYYDTPTCECPNDSNNAYDSFFKTNLNVCAQFNETNSIVYTSCTGNVYLFLIVYYLHMSMSNIHTYYYPDEVSTLVTYYEKGDCTGMLRNIKQITYRVLKCDEGRMCVNVHIFIEVFISAPACYFNIIEHTYLF